MRGSSSTIQGVVGRAEFKIFDAFQEFSKKYKLSLKDKLVLDIGSSTGGFTEFALRMGARKVIAVEKGTKQMKAPLCFDPRVELHEKTDIFEFNFKSGASELEFPDVILADVSFVSLRKILVYAKKNLCCDGAEFLVMLKPQFEAPQKMLRRGVLKNNKMRREIIVDFEAWLKANGFLIVAKKDNEVAGRFGNVERFYYLKLCQKPKAKN